jgi:diguanylate cyclase (GGDEF)-like protein
LTTPEHTLHGRVYGFFSTDRRKIALLALTILLIAMGGVELSRVVSARLLQREAQAMARGWAMSLAGSPVNLPDIIAGVTPSDATRNLLNEAMDVGHIYRIKVWNSEGKLVFVYDRGNELDPAQAVASDSPAMTAQRRGSPAYLAESFVRIKRNGVPIGVVEAYIDQTEHKAFYDRFFLISESILGLVVLLAGGLPAWMVYRRMRDHRRAEAEAQFLAEHDSLTGLANRKRLAEAAAAALGWTRRNGTFVAVLMFDLHRFKEVNESFGHEAGDEVLRQFSIRLRAAVRVEDKVGRLGGDEFVVLQVGATQPEHASVLAERLLELAAEPYEIDGMQLECGTNIGIAVAPTDARDWDSLLSCADVALAKAKTEGGNGVCFFEAGMDVVYRERRQLEAALRRALLCEAFQLAYQPIYSFRDHRLLGFEALLRWPEGWPPESPARFIPVAEESGLMVPIGAWVLETACKAAASWKSPVKVAVNLSPVQFQQGDVVAAVEEALLVSGLDPQRLELEVTESLWLRDTDRTLDQLHRLRALGVAIALDDFGTGYSSLTYLWKFPFNKVKIDRSFVTDMMRQPKAAAIVNTIIALSRVLNLTVTAEGVEVPAQAQALSDAGCDEVQGFLFGRPLTFAAASALAAEKKVIPRTLTDEAFAQKSISA